MAAEQADRQHADHRRGRAVRRHRRTSARRPQEFVAACERALRRGRARARRARRAGCARSSAGTSWDATARGDGATLIDERRSRRKPREQAATPRRRPRAATRAGRRHRRRADRPERRLPPRARTRCCSSRTTASAAGAARSRTTASRSTTPATSCSRTTRTCTSCTRCCSATTSTGRTARRGSTARTSTRATRSRARCTACRRTCIKECIVGAIEARFGASKAEAEATPARATANGNGRNGTRTATAARRRLQGRVDHRLLRRRHRWRARRRSPSARHAPPSARPSRRNFEEFIYKVWGAGIAKHFAIPYNRKLWAVPLTEMETSWLGGRVPLPDLEEMIEGALRPVPQADGAERPLRLSAARRLPGADGRLPAAPARRAAAEHARRRRSRPSRHIGHARRRHASCRTSSSISTMPLPVLIRLIGDEAPARRAAGGRAGCGTSRCAA